MSTSELDAAYLRFLGSAAARYGAVAAEDGIDLDITEHHGVPADGALSLATRGLRWHARCADCDGPLDQELLMCCWGDQFTQDLVTLLGSVASEQAKAGRALAWGEVLPPAGPLLPGATTEALYVSQPGYFDEQLAAIASEGRTVRVRWLVPVHASEAAWIAEQGHEAFESLLEREDPDLLDLQRPAVV